MVMMEKPQIGNLLVEAGIISAKTLERALAKQKGSGKRLGALLREMGIVTEEEVLEALARQCHLKTVRKFAEHGFAKELLDLVPGRLALEKMIFPLKQHEGMLAVATLDPFDDATFNFLAGKTGMRIFPVLASRDDIAAAIRKHYRLGMWAAGRRQRVLLIDPSPVVTQLLQLPIENEGYEVLVAHDGVEGLKLVFSRHPDLVLCDLMMPRMDCYTFMHAVKAHPETSEIPMILLSAKVSLEEEHHALKTGFVDFIGKPAMPIRVIVKIKRALAQQDTRDQAASPVGLPSAAEQPPSPSSRPSPRGKRRG